MTKKVYKIMKRVRNTAYNFEHKHKRRRKIREKKKPVNYYDSDESDGGSDYEDSFFSAGSNVYSKGNRIYFRSKVSAASVSTLIDIINKKNKEIEEVEKNPIIQSVQPKPLYLHITSYGGCLFSGFRAVDAIKRSKIPIYTVVDGHAASAATLMSVVGVKRFMTPHSYLLIHQLSSGVIGKFWEMKDEYHNCKHMMDDIYNIYTGRTKMDRQELEDQLSHDSWWNIEKCIEVGLVDEVLE